MKMTIVVPKKIVKSENTENVKNLLIKKPLQIGLYEPICTSVKDGYVILDFGKEMNGSVRILTCLVEGGGTAKIRVRFGESLTEACSTVGEKGQTNDHSPRDFEALLTSYSDITLGASGYRYIRIDFIDGKKVVLQGIVGTNNMYKGKPIYKYSGEDKRIAKIFETAKRTVDLCLGNGLLWDGVKRDRLVWMGDIHPEMLALVTIYGRVKELENSLNFVKAQAPLPMYMNGFPTYSMWWIAIVCDYCAYTRCVDYAKAQIEYMQGLLSLMDGLVEENGKMNYHFLFVDWPTHEQVDEVVGSRFINIIAVKKAIEFLQGFGENTETAEKLLQKLLKGDMTVKDKKQVVALKYFALGEISDEEYAMLIEGGAKGMSTFMSYYVLTAIASRNKQLAIDIMKEYYGAMLDKGATTFWEDFSMDWVEGSGRIDKFPKKNEKDIHGDYGAYCYLGFRHSLCHGWSSGVVKFIQENC